jgi:hypothetical protein
MDVGDLHRAPTGRRHPTVKGLILLEREEVEHGAGHAGEAAEIPDRCRVDVDAVEAAELGAQLPTRAEPRLRPLAPTLRPQTKWKTRISASIEIVSCMFILNAD